MASGHVNRIQKAEHMAAPTNAANVKKALANSEPSTHGPLRRIAASQRYVRCWRVSRHATDGDRSTLFDPMPTKAMAICGVLVTSPFDHCDQWLARRPRRALILFGQFGLAQCISQDGEAFWRCYVARHQTADCEARLNLEQNLGYRFGLILSSQSN